VGWPWRCRARAGLRYILILIQIRSRVPGECTGAGIKPCLGPLHEREVILRPRTHRVLFADDSGVDGAIRAFFGCLRSNSDSLEMNIGPYEGLRARVKGRSFFSSPPPQSWNQGRVPDTSGSPFGLRQHRVCCCRCSSVADRRALADPCG